MSEFHANLLMLIQFQQTYVDGFVEQRLPAARPVLDNTLDGLPMGQLNACILEVHPPALLQ